MVDIRLLGRDYTQHQMATVARDARPWLTGGIIGMVLTGVPQFNSLATQEYHSEFFRNKMLFFLAALIFTFTVRRMVAFAPEGRFGPLVGKLVAIISIVLWSGIAIEARLIGLFS